MSTSIIYEPKGRAREYSALACNLFTGCLHGCKYCYAPGCLHQTREQFHSGIKVKKDALHRLDADAAKLAGDPREILFSFFSDPYQNDESAAIMLEALEICSWHNLNVQVLTKGGLRAQRHFHIFHQHGWKFGSTISFICEAMRWEWEPGAATIQDRINAVKDAHSMGIFTWVSVEPVIEAESALLLMESLVGHVDLWKVGKINHNRELESQVDWKWFLSEAREVLNGERVVWKDDLISSGGGK